MVLGRYKSQDFGVDTLLYDHGVCYCIGSTTILTYTQIIPREDRTALTRP